MKVPAHANPPVLLISDKKNLGLTRKLVLKAAGIDADLELTSEVMRSQTISRPYSIAVIGHSVEPNDKRSIAALLVKYKIQMLELYMGVPILDAAIPCNVLEGPEPMIEQIRFLLSKAEGAASATGK